MAAIEHQGRTYAISEMFRVDKNGFELELVEETGDPIAGPRLLAWVFGPEHSEDVTVHVEPGGAPLALVERLVALARERLPVWRSRWD
jgi:hypothetical protein